MTDMTDTPPRHLHIIIEGAPLAGKTILANLLTQFLETLNYEVVSRVQETHEGPRPGYAAAATASLRHLKDFRPTQISVLERYPPAAPAPEPAPGDVILGLLHDRSGKAA